ncbi:MAG: cupin domain-containing protein [Clostridium sp.]|nr:cupin domain-containing protein [Clostridium sp.]
MKKKGFQVLKIAEDMRQAVIELFKDMENDAQTLSKDSEKPLVVHHDTKQMSYVVKGQGYVAVNDNILKIIEGDLIIIDKKSTHSFICSEGDIELMHIHWPKANVDLDREVINDYYSAWDKYIK